jgi:DNA polymerase-1
MRLVFDIETDNLLPKLTTFHCAGALDLDTGDEYWFRPHQLKEFLNKLDEADVIIAHNAFGFDVPALTKLCGWTPKAKVQCTKVMSQVLNYRRFGFGHSLKRWGEELGDQKGDYTGGFETFNEDMFVYMQQDVRLLAKVYKRLLSELKRWMSRPSSKAKSVVRALRNEMDLDAIMVEQCSNGWLFDLKAAKNLHQDITIKMKEMEAEINALLGVRVVAKDSSVRKIKKEIELLKSQGIIGYDKEGYPFGPWPDAEYKEPKFTKAGKYAAHTSSWFGLDSKCIYDLGSKSSLPVWDSYTRVEFENGDIGNTDTVKDYLYSIGWQPDEWNWKKRGKEFFKTSAKLSDSSLERLGGVGKILMEYYTLRSRRSILQGWFPHVDENSRLHGDVFNIGTPTFRQTHKIIANLPSGQATLGKEFRSLFIAREGYSLVSADSAACQLRLLAHYMTDPDFTDTVLNGDVHQMNANILDCTRPQAKRFIFAYLYGAGAQKLSGYIEKSLKETKKSMNKYKKALPALAELIDAVNKNVEEKGWIEGLDGRAIVLNKEDRHKALNYLIQGAEAVVMKYTVAMAHEQLKAANIDAAITLFYHDEQAEQAREILIQAFEEAPKELGIDIMTCGDCKIGKDYYDVH